MQSLVEKKEGEEEEIEEVGIKLCLGEGGVEIYDVRTRSNLSNFAHSPLIPPNCETQESREIL